jgi:hypothetical protein
MQAWVGKAAPVKVGGFLCQLTKGLVLRVRSA